MESLVERWQGLEDKTILSADAIADKANNPLIKTVMHMIQHDSRKHKLMLRSILDMQKSEALHLSPDELQSLAQMLNAHMELEAEAIDVAANCFAGNRLFATTYLLSSLMEEEMKHHRMIAELLDSLKLESISSSSGVRSAWV